MRKFFLIFQQNTQRGRRIMRISIRMLNRISINCVFVITIKWIPDFGECTKGRSGKRRNIPRANLQQGCYDQYNIYQYYKFSYSISERTKQPEYNEDCKLLPCQDKTTNNAFKLANHVSSFCMVQIIQPEQNHERIQYFIRQLQMGCGTVKDNTTTVPIGKSLVHLLQTKQNDKIISRLEAEGKQIYEQKLNFRDDTIMHYACSTDNEELIKYILKMGVNFNVANSQNKYPQDYITNQSTLNLLKNGSGQTQSTTQAAKQLNPIVPSKVDAREVKLFMKKPNENIQNEHPELSFNGSTAHLDRSNKRRQQSKLTNHLKNNAPPSYEYD